MMPERSSMLKAFVRPHVREHPTTGAPIPVKGYENTNPSMRLTPAPALDRREWIGVDLDKTLAHHEKGAGISGPIGHPIPKMIARTKRWLREGKRVKIFTARAQDVQQIAKVQAWLVTHGLPKLEVTNVKDHLMEKLIDDKAIQVKSNIGELVRKGRVMLVFHAKRHSR